MTPWMWLVHSVGAHGGGWRRSKFSLRTQHPSASRIRTYARRRSVDRCLRASMRRDVRCCHDVGISVICYPNACDLLPNRIHTHSHACSCIFQNYISSYIDSILQGAHSTAFTVHSTLQTHSQCIYIHSHLVLHSCIDALLTVSMKLHSRCILKSQLW